MRTNGSDDGIGTDGRLGKCISALFSETGDFSKAEAGPFRLAHQPAPRILPTPLPQRWDCRCALCLAFDVNSGAQTQGLKLVQHTLKFLILRQGLTKLSRLAFNLLYSRYLPY